MALAMQVPKTCDSNPYSLRPHAVTQASQAGRYLMTVTDEPNLTWGLGTKVLDVLSVIGIIADRFRSVGLKHSPTVCGKSAVGTSSDNTIVIRSDIHDKIACIYDICKYKNAVEQIAPAARQVEAAKELPSYPVA